MVGAAVDTLRKAWRAGVDLQARAGEHPRIASIASLEETYPCGPSAGHDATRRPGGGRAAKAGPCRRAVRADRDCRHYRAVAMLAASSACDSYAGAGSMDRRPASGSPPGSMAASSMWRATEPHAPEIITVSASTAYHEAIEALRWARQLIASGTADPAEIAIASVTPADYDDHFLALRADANLDLHFVHGVKITACREGQAAAALADILVRGLSQTRMRRLASLLAAYPGPFQGSPGGLDASPAGRCSAGVSPSLDPPARPSGGRRLARRNRSWPGAARDHLSAVAGRSRG